MALSILDGNQTATTLSTVVTGGQHIPAHTVVSLGATAISNIASAVSGAIISGTVTANGGNFVSFEGVDPANPVGIGFKDSAYSGDFVAVRNDPPDRAFPVQVLNTPQISGTVTANVPNLLINEAAVANGIQIFGYNEDQNQSYALRTSLVDVGALKVEPISLPSISGTVTIGNSITIGSCVTHGVTIANSSVTVGIGAMPNGALTTRFGTPVTANQSFATSAVTNASRKYLLIQNVTTGSNVITVGIGFTPTTTQGIQLTAGAGITFESSYIPTGAVYVLSSVTASNFTILEA